MDIIAAYHQTGSYRAAADLCGTTHKTVRRVIERAALLAAGEPVPPRAPRMRNYDQITDLVADRIKTSKGKISAKRLLPVATAAGYTGSARNFRRLVVRFEYHAQDGLRFQFDTAFQSRNVDRGLRESQSGFCERQIAFRFDQFE